MNRANLLVHSAAQLCVVPPHEGGVQRGRRLGDLGLIEDGAVACSNGMISAVGPTDEVRSEWSADQEIDASGCLVCPGFVDAHTHVVWSGSRADEFVQRIRGAGYAEIMSAGGGIMSTVRATRNASVGQLVAESAPRLKRMLAHGTTTAEVKSGYGLTVEDELKQLESISALRESQPVSLISTFLGAHAVPAEYFDDPDAYIDIVINEMLPATAELPERLRFCDVFCDVGAFTLDQTRRVLEAARELGLDLKLHVDEFEALGATSLAVELGATSVDHVVCTPPDELRRLARSDVVAVSLPATTFGLGHHDYTPTKAFLDANGILALATDCNPGTSPCESMPFVIALACRYLHLTPAQALVAATLNAAAAIGMADQIGSLRTGYAADLLVLDLPTIDYLGYGFGGNPVRIVIKSGKVAVGSQ